jgi:ABC-type uncharacterized transport system substrate-binding protein
VLEKFLISLAEKMAPIIAEKLLALLPVIAAAVAKSVADEIVKHLPTLDIPGVSDMGALADQVRDNINESIHDIDIPILSDIFDLTDFFHRGKTG